MKTFEQVHHKLITRQTEMVLAIESEDGYWKTSLEESLQRLGECLEEMRLGWDGKEYELIEMYPGYIPVWMYLEQMQADEDDLYTICSVCGYGVNEEEYIAECLTCDEAMCLYCHEGQPCPDHGVKVEP